MKTIKIYDLGFFELEGSKEMFLQALEEKFKEEEKYRIERNKKNANIFLITYINKVFRPIRRKVMLTEIIGEFNTETQVKVIIQLNFWTAIITLIYGSIAIISIILLASNGKIQNVLFALLVIISFSVIISILTFIEVLYHRKAILRYFTTLVKFRLDLYE